MWYYITWEIKARRHPSYVEGTKSPPTLMEGGLPMVTYSDLIQIGIFIVALIGLIIYRKIKGLE
jgi:hypothetical protein